MGKRSGVAATETIGLTADDVVRLTSLYNGRLSEHGISAKTVGWASISDQYLRFEVLCRGLDLRGRRVLDIGCGLGDFVPWAEARYGADFDYTGIDLSADLVAAARERFGGARRHFVAGTLPDGDDVGMFDIALLSGALTFKTTDNMAVMRSILASAWKHCAAAVCCNFMTGYADSRLEKNFHYSPEEVFAFAHSLSRFVVLYHDYDLWEFTIQILRQPSLKRVPST